MESQINESNSRLNNSSLVCQSSQVSASTSSTTSSVILSQIYPSVVPVGFSNRLVSTPRTYIEKLDEKFSQELALFNSNKKKFNQHWIRVQNFFRFDEGFKKQKALGLEKLSCEHQRLMKTRAVIVKKLEEKFSQEAVLFDINTKEFKKDYKEPGCSGQDKRFEEVKALRLKILSCEHQQLMKTHAMLASFLLSSSQLLEMN